MAEEKKAEKEQRVSKRVFGLGYWGVLDVRKEGKRRERVLGLETWQNAINGEWFSVA